MTPESPLQFALRVARDWYSGGHGDLAHLIAVELERREASRIDALPPAGRDSGLDHRKDASGSDAV